VDLTRRMIKSAKQAKGGATRSMGEKRDQLHILREGGFGGGQGWGGGKRNWVKGMGSMCGGPSERGRDLD